MVVMTGEIDWISDGEVVVKLENGSHYVRKRVPPLFLPLAFCLSWWISAFDFQETD